MLFHILRDVPAGPVSLNADIPEPLAEIIGKCLQKDRELRYQYAWEIGIDLRKLRQSRMAGTSVATIAPEEANESFAGASSCLDVGDSSGNFRGRGRASLYRLPGCARIRKLFSQITTS